MQKFGRPDAENPEWTAEDFANARPGRDVLPAEFLREAAAAQRRRGPQRAPTKRLVSLRLDVDVLERFRATGKGWQGRINQTLAAHAPRSRRPTPSKRTRKSAR
jgi:uncharacterized protein (DUF4415 family)